MNSRTLFAAVLTLCVFAGAQPKFDIHVENSGVRKDNAEINYNIDCLQLVYWHILSTKKGFGLMLTRPDNTLKNPRIKQVGLTSMVYNTGTLLLKGISEKTIEQGEMTFFLADRTTLRKNLGPYITSSLNPDDTA